jgi:serine protease
VKIRALLAAGIAVAATAAAVAAPGLAAAAAAGPAGPSRVTATVQAPPDVQVPGLRIHAVNLHSRFERALTTEHVVAGRKAGVVPMANEPGALAATAATGAAATGAASAASPCNEPNCDMSRHGGAVQHAPHVYLLLWGPDWATSGSNANAVANYLAAFFYGLGQTSYDSWSTTTSQYRDATGQPAFGAPVLDLSSHVYNDSSIPPATVTPDVIASEAGGLASAANIKDTADAQILVAFESGTCFSDGFGGNCGQVQTSGYCAWHSAAVSTTNTSVYLPFVNLPWQLDAGTGCGANFVNSGSAGLFDGWSMVGGHEYAETITDPNPPTGYIDDNDVNGTTASGGEIADKCAWGGVPFGVTDPFGDVTLRIGTNSQNQVVTYPFAMQSLWSNAAGRCVMKTTPTLSVATPATQKSILGRAISLQIHATSNIGVQSYKATGLPPGLAINARTGRITGKPAVTAGTFRPKITVSNYAKSAAISFTWQVSSAAGPVKGYASKCVDDSGGHTSNGNKIDIWTCTGKAAQRITFAANRELIVLGKCITGGNTAFLEPCKAATSQTWTRRSNGEYVLAANGKCLTDPSKANGTRLTLAACKNTANQHWSLP